jgi:hypothetical protein
MTAAPNCETAAYGTATVVPNPSLFRAHFCSVLESVWRTGSFAWVFLLGCFCLDAFAWVLLLGYMKWLVLENVVGMLRIVWTKQRKTPQIYTFRAPSEVFRKWLTRTSHKTWIIEVSFNPIFEVRGCVKQQERIWKVCLIRIFKLASRVTLSSLLLMWTYVNHHAAWWFLRDSIIQV